MCVRDRRGCSYGWPILIPRLGCRDDQLTFLKGELGAEPTSCRRCHGLLALIAEETGSVLTRELGGGGSPPAALWSIAWAPTPRWGCGGTSPQRRRLPGNDPSCLSSVLTIPTLLTTPFEQQVQPHQNKRNMTRPSVISAGDNEERQLSRPRLPPHFALALKNSSWKRRP